MTAGIVKSFGVALIWRGRHSCDSSHALHASHTTNDECTHKNYRELPVFSVREKPIQNDNSYQSSDHGSGNRSADCHKSLAKMSGGSVGLLGHGSNKVGYRGRTAKLISGGPSAQPLCGLQAAV
jgi:hypothetical protein